MAKLGVGVGQEFPVGEPAPPPPQSSEPGRHCGRHSHRFGWLHFTLHILLRVAIIALVIAAAVSLFRPHEFPPYGYPYHHGFFPFFPVVVIALFFAFAWRRGGRHRRRNWHGEARGDDRGEA